MSQPTPFDEFEAMVTDYINGRLTASDRERFEAAMANDQRLQDTVAFEREIKSVIATDAVAESELPRFASLEEKLGVEKKSSWFGGLRWGAPVAATVMLAVVISVGSQLRDNHNDYQTLTDRSVSYDQVVLRIITLRPMSAPDQAELVEQFDLRVVKEYAGANTMDVTAGASADISELAETLRQDDRIRFVSVIDETTD